VQQELQQASVCVQQASVCNATRPATREMQKDRSCNKTDATRKELQQEHHPHGPPIVWV